MRLMNTESWDLETFDHSNQPSYAILSHRWEDEEVTLQEVSQGITIHKKGFEKILRCCEVAANAGHQYVWIDTCCIDKTSSAELSEAINSMYAWYRDAKACYAYLSDVHTVHDLQASAWFTRGWTLQELIAPASVTFFNDCWQNIGTKHGMQKTISEITGIPTRVLRDGSHVSACSIAQRMSWASQRKTQRIEDQAYSLLGLFDVNMPMIYGEGKNAFSRLQEEIIKNSNDQSIFAWKTGKKGPRGILAASPLCFGSTGNCISVPTLSNPEPYSMTNVGLSITLRIKPWTLNVYIALLDCHDKNDETYLMPSARVDAEKTRIAIFLQQTSNDRQFARTSDNDEELRTFHLDRGDNEFTTLRVLLLNKAIPFDHYSKLYGYVFRNITFTAYPSSPFWYSSITLAAARRYHLRQIEDSSEHDLVKVMETPARCDRWHRHGYLGSRESYSVPQLISHLLPGESGTAFELSMVLVSLNLPGAPLSEQLHSFASIDGMKFGFDFLFNPVGMFWKRGSSKNNPVLFEDKGDYWIQVVDELSETQPSDSWEQSGVCGVRFDRRSGGTLNLPSLGIELSVTLGWKTWSTRAWTVDIYPSSGLLPSIFMPKILRY